MEITKELNITLYTDLNDTNTARLTGWEVIESKNESVLI